MWYEESSVITAIEQCSDLKVDFGYVPSCPKKGNNIHCHTDFPDCEGKTLKCRQILNLINEHDDPSTLVFDYFVSADTRKGRIKKSNVSLQWLAKRYHINKEMMISL